MRKFFFILVILLSSSIGWSRPAIWLNPDSPFLRSPNIINLGTVMISEGFRPGAIREINLPNYPRIECNLTHLKFTALNDTVRIARVVVFYRNGQRDAIDLTDDYRPGNPFMGGLRLNAYQSSRWINVGDVMDDHRSGRCIDRIRIFATERPSWADPFNWRRAAIRVHGLIRPRMLDPRPIDPMFNSQHLGYMNFNMFVSDQESLDVPRSMDDIRGIELRTNDTVHIQRIAAICRSGEVCWMRTNLHSEADQLRYYFPAPLDVRRVEARGSGGQLQVLLIR